MNQGENINTGDVAAATSFVSALAHFATQVQPIISMLAGLVAIVSGVFAMRYYYIKSKHYGEK